MLVSLWVVDEPVSESESLTWVSVQTRSDPRLIGNRGSEELVSGLSRPQVTNKRVSKDDDIFASVAGSFKKAHSGGSRSSSSP